MSEARRQCVCVCERKRKGGRERECVCRGKVRKKQS